MSKLGIDDLPFEIHLLILENIPDLYTLRSASQSRVFPDISPSEFKRIEHLIFMSKHAALDGEGYGILLRDLLATDDRELLEKAWQLFRNKYLEELLIPIAMRFAKRYSEADRTDDAVGLLKSIWAGETPFGWSSKFRYPRGVGGSAMWFSRARHERIRLQRPPSLFPLGTLLINLLPENDPSLTPIREEVERIGTAYSDTKVAFVGAAELSFYRDSADSVTESLSIDGMLSVGSGSDGHCSVYPPFPYLMKVSQGSWRLLGYNIPPLPDISDRIV